MYKVILPLILLFVTGMAGRGQERSLDECLQLAREHYPLTEGLHVMQSSTDLKLKNLRTAWYPQMDLGGQISWQNDVPHLDSPSPGFEVPQAPKDQYKAYVDVRQIIYDGGITRSKRELEAVAGETDQLNLEVEIYGIRSRVIDTYYLLLLLDEQEKQTNLSIENLTHRLKEVNVRVENGVMLESEADVFRVEILKLKQQLIGIEEARLGGQEIMAEFTGAPLAGVVKPEMLVVLLNDSLIQRPEISLFRSQLNQLEAARKVSGKTRMPNLSGFGQVGYGNPGFNMLLDSFEPFYMVGVRLNWRICDWNKTSREKKIYDHQKQLVNQREDAFSQNVRMASSNLEARVRKLDKIVASDEEIVTLRKRITKASVSKLENGVITASDYISDLNQQYLAALSMEIHKLELSKAYAEYKNLLGVQ
ncbi:TolC family protein [Marinilabiliaceae bacterium JC017]|nr:TolC family protein [Marinilabiliaceae bacterium JC017]